MEEGLSANETTLERLRPRFEATYRKTMVDVRGDFQAVPDHMAWFQPGAPIQATWKYLIALFLYLKLETRPTKDQIRECQISSFGDEQLKQNALLELMPLPSSQAHENAWL